MTSDPTERVGRRHVLQTIAGLGSVSIAGCVGTEGENPTDEKENETTATDENRDATTVNIDESAGSLEWKFTEPIGKVTSSPTIVDGTVYVGSSGDFGGDFAALYALDAVTGEREWKFTESGESVRSSPAVVNGTV